LHQNIVECQQNIVDMEAVGSGAGNAGLVANGGDNEGQNEGEEEALAAILDVRDLGADEARYLLGKLMSMTVNQCCQSLQRDAQVRELENRIAQITHQSTLHQQLLQHMIEQQDLEVYDLMLSNERGEDEDDSSDSSEANDSADEVTNGNGPAGVHLSLSMVAGIDDTPTSDSSTGRRDKARRKRTTKDELLFNDTDVPQIQSSPLGEALLSPAKRGAPAFARSLSFTKPAGRDLMFRSRSFVKPSGGGFGYGVSRGGRGQGFGSGRPNLAPLYQHQHSMNANSMTQSMVDPTSASKIYQPSPMFSRRTLEKQQQQQQQSNLRSSMRKYSSAARLNNDAESSSSPPGSPPTFRRSGSIRADDGRNVFHRLVAGTRIGETAGQSAKGKIIPFQGRIAPRAPLICCNVAEGHTRAVLSVFANDDLLLTGSKDRTVKVWDLVRKEEVTTLAGHPNNVSVVKYSEASRLAFSVSTAFIKVWDLRVDPSRAGCIKTLSSSGLTTTGPVQPSGAALPGSRTLQLPTGETLVNDIALAPSGFSLFSAAGDKVRVWDLRKFHSIGKLSGGHNAAVMCLASSRGPDDEGDYVVTGSKDHYVKVFRVQEGRGGVVTPSANLDPPHYDGVQCLTVRDDVLFSASRDTCIKKWDLASGGELVRSLNNAHKDWICGLAFLPGGNTLVSGCRAGQIKLWDSQTCTQTGEMKAHNSTINAIGVNGSLLFTASNDGSVGFWRVRRDFDRSPDSDTS